MNAFKLQRSQEPNHPYYSEIQAAGNYETLATSETYVSKGRRPARHRPHHGRGRQRNGCGRDVASSRARGHEARANRPPRRPPARLDAFPSEIDKLAGRSRLAA